MTDNRKATGDNRADNDRATPGFDAELDSGEFAPFATLSHDLKNGLDYARPVAAPGLERRAVAGAWMKLRRRRIQRLAWRSGLTVAAAAATALVALRWAPADDRLADGPPLLAASETRTAPARPNGTPDSRPAAAPDEAPLAPAAPPAALGPDETREAALAERERQLEERERQLEERSRQLEDRIGAGAEGDRSFAGELAALAGELERAHQELASLERDFEANADRLSRDEIARFKAELRDRWRRVKELERSIEQKASEAARRASAVGQDARRRAMELEREASRRAVDAYRREEADRTSAVRERQRQERERVRRLRLRGEGKDNDWRWEWQWRSDDCGDCQGGSAKHDHEHGNDRDRGDYRLNFRGNDVDGELDFDVMLELDDETAELLDGAARIIGNEFGHVLAGEQDLGEAVAVIVERAVEEALQEAEQELDGLDEELARELRRELGQVRIELEREAERAQRDVQREIEQAQLEAQRELHEAQREIDEAQREIEEARREARRDMEEARREAQRDMEEARRKADEARRGPGWAAPPAQSHGPGTPKAAPVPRRPAPDLEAYRRQVRERFRQRQQEDSASPGPSVDAQRATVEVRSTPPGASVVVDGRKVGATPRTVTLEPGTHTIAVVGTNGVEISRDLTVAAGESLRISDDLR